MDILLIVAVLLTLSAVFAFINYHFLKMPRTIGLMFISLIGSIVLIILGKLGLSNIYFVDLISSIDFNKTLMDGMLGVLLFAGALHVNLGRLLKQKWIIVTLASMGLISTTFMIGSILYYILGYFGLNISYLYCLLFGALISPTDPIAVLGILRKNKVSESLNIKITGESLFNDGFGVVVFLTLFGVLTGEHHFSLIWVTELFLLEVIGGILFGLLAGYITYKMLKTVDRYQVEVLLTLALVFGGYYLAGALHLSAPLMIVVAGLFIGNKGRKYGMSEETRLHLDNFWDLIDEILNALLFVLIGLEMILIELNFQFIILGIISIFVVLFARFISIGITLKLFSLKRSFTKNAIKILTWGGLRGGISIALALSLPAGPERNLLLTITYIVVIFSILVQGMTLKYFIKD